MIKVGSLVCIDNTPGVWAGELDIEGNPFNLGRWSLQKRSEVLAIEGDILLLSHLETQKEYRLPMERVRLIM
jgi:hypothetical protein